MYKIELHKQAVKDAKTLERAGMKPKAAELLQVIRDSPYQNPPPYEKLKGLQDTYSRRVNKQHRLVYQVLSNDEGLTDENDNKYSGIVRVLRMWTHYE